MVADEYVHPDYGMVRVYWRLESGFRGLVPFSFELDLLIPDGEVEALTKWIEGVRLDRSISVSAVSFHDEVDPYAPTDSPEGLPQSWKPDLAR